MNFACATLVKLNYGKSFLVSDFFSLYKMTEINYEVFNGPFQILSSLEFGHQHSVLLMAVVLSTVINLT